MSHRTLLFLSNFFFCFQLEKLTFNYFKLNAIKKKHLFFSGHVFVQQVESTPRGKQRCSAILSVRAGGGGRVCERGCSKQEARLPAGDKSAVDPAGRSGNAAFRLERRRSQPLAGWLRPLPPPLPPTRNAHVSENRTDVRLTHTKKMEASRPLHVSSRQNGVERAVQRGRAETKQYCSVCKCTCYKSTQHKARETMTHCPTRWES